MTDIIFLVLLFAHIGTVILWMGAAVLYVSILGPSIAKLAPSSRADLMKAIGKNYESYIVRNATIAIAAGLILYGYITQVATNYAPSSSGMPWILIGILSGIVAYVIGIVVVMRNNRKLMRMMDQMQGSGSPSPEMTMVQKRLMAGAGLQVLFLFVALLCMVVGANL